MVNNVGGSNPNIYVDPRNQGNTGNNTQQVNQPQAKGYRPDGYAFNMNSPNDQPVPDVKIGFFDKMGITFKDVLNTDDNVKRFVAFEQAVKTNPNGYLQPGSNDVTKTTDLQKKLKFVGMNITVNGQFGKATEQAVINFKNSVGINDGFLTKKGEYSVSGTMTPQAWGVLNATVAARMNPNAAISNGTYTPPVTKAEMQWAKELQNKIANFGYKPSPEERTKYEDVYQRQRMTMEIKTGSFDPTQVAKPTDSEMQWAQDLAAKMKQFGYKPSAAEKTKYQDVFQRIQVTKGNPVQTTEATKPHTQKTQITQADVDWSVNLMNKVKGGYNPTPAEAAKYEKVYNALQNNGTGSVKKTEPAKASPPTQEELTWASNLEAKVGQGYNPTAQEKDKYNGIFEKYKANPTKSENTEVTKTGKPSDSEVKWAQNLENNVNNNGYQPSQAEIDKYTDISNRLNASQADETDKTDATAQVNQPKDPFHGKTVEKFGKIGSAASDWGKAHPGTTFPRENIFYANNDGKLISQTMLNSAAKQGGDYIGNLGLNRAPALYIPGFTASKAENYSYVNGHIYNNSALNDSVSNNSEDTQTVSKPANKPRPQNKPVQQNQDVQNNDSNGGVSQEELDWAQSLQARSAQGYQPTQQEVAIYTDIYKRSQSGAAPQQNNQQPVQNTTRPQSNNNVTTTNNTQSQNVNVDPTNGDQELQWALALLDKVQQQGYQPTEQELTQYEQIIAKNQQVPATP